MERGDRVLSVLVPACGCIYIRLIESLRQRTRRLYISRRVLITSSTSRRRCGGRGEGVGSVPRYECVRLPRGMKHTHVQGLLKRDTRCRCLLFVSYSTTIMSRSCLTHCVRDHRGSPIICNKLIRPSALPSPSRILTCHCRGRTRHHFSLGGERRGPCHSFQAFGFVIHQSIFLRGPFSRDVQGCNRRSALFKGILRRGYVPVLRVRGPLVGYNLSSKRGLVQGARVSLRALCSLHSGVKSYSTMLRLCHCLRHLRLINLATFMCEGSHSFLFEGLARGGAFLAFFAFCRVKCCYGCSVNGGAG